MTDYAKIGYEAYRAASGGTTFDGRPMPTWEELEQLPHGERTRRLWAEAAEAIVADGRRVFRGVLREQVIAGLWHTQGTQAVTQSYGSGKMSAASEAAHKLGLDLNPPPTQEEIEAWARGAAMADREHRPAPPPDTDANVRELRATIIALRRLLSIGSLDEALPAASRVPALKLTTDALGILERFLLGAHSIQDAASAAAVLIIGVDLDGRFIQQTPPPPGEQLRKMTDALKQLARAGCDAAVERATFAAPRVTACSRCDHMMEDRLKLLGEIEDLNLKLEATRAQLREGASNDVR